jgi:hypothetical protein
VRPPLSTEREILLGVPLLGKGSWPSSFPPVRNGIASNMANKAYVVRLKPPRRDVYLVTADRAETQGEHLVFLSSEGKLLVLILFEIIESWTETEQA